MAAANEKGVLANPSVVRVADALRAAGIDSAIVELPGGAHTAKLAAQFLGCELGQIANSLVFRGVATNGAILVMSSGAKRVDIAKLAVVAGEEIGKKRITGEGGSIRNPHASAPRSLPDSRSG